MGRINIDESELRGRVFATAAGELDRVADDLKTACQQECPVQTGRLLRSHKVVRVSPEFAVVLADTPYARNVFDGEGPNGPRRPNRWMLRGIDRMRL